ncbi:hypothetical protein, conserved [Plasmodium ovale]|uniref:PIR protein n=1 Tax=Plasmodium ovale TaxID=36330 RepID=A0A1C3KHU3_PLAOA|nr:hypothetical protein, conserved [Plasmodium ovale]
MTYDEDITSLKCEFVDDSRVKTIDEEFPEKCEDNSDRQKCFTETQDASEYCRSVTHVLQKLKEKIIEILQGKEGDSNAFFFNGNIENVKKQCTCLKQWFYNEVIKDAKEKTNGYKLLKKCNSNIYDKINTVTANFCTFQNLNFREILRMKTIFDFYLFYYAHIKDLTVGQKLNQYTKYFKEGLYEHCNSIIECLNNTTNSKYCKEFKEYHNNYNAFMVFLKSLISYPEKIDGSDSTYGCVLSQRLFNGQYLLKLREEIQRIRSRYSSTDSQTTAITITPNELWLRIKKLKNKETHVIVDDETESNSLFTSEYLENNSKRKGYSISYKSAIYS